MGTHWRRRVNPMLMGSGAEPREFVPKIAVLHLAMCELFAMSSRFPADVHFSLEAFSRRGGLTGRHKDGWGIAYYVDEDVRLVKEPQPAADSVCVRFIQDHPFASAIVISHIRRATRGAPAMKNCQPFQRELGGRAHLFAHNGDLDLEALRARMRLVSFHPIGETDSEHAFCALLERLRGPWLRGGVPPLDERRGLVARFAAEIRVLGPANFIYSDGDAVFFYGHKRMHDEGAAPRPPGLHLLCRRCASDARAVNAEGLSVALGPEQEVVLAASMPLTDELGWRALAEGELVVAQRGRVITGTPATQLAHQK
jgi:predicted glutamine amidotransferase